MGRWRKTNTIFFRALPRRQLQRLCKKHGIPANTASAAMAEALCRLFKSEFLPGQLKVPKVEPYAPCQSEVCEKGSGTSAFEDLHSMLQELKDEQQAPTEWPGLTNDGQEQEEHCGATTAITEDCCLLVDESPDKYERLERFTASVEELFVWEEDDGPEINKPEQVEAQTGNRLEAVEMASRLEHLGHAKTTGPERVMAPEDGPQQCETVIESLELDGAAKNSSIPQSTGVADAEPNDSCGLENFTGGDVAEACAAPCQPPTSMEFYVEKAEGLSLVVELNSEHSPVEELFQHFRRLESISEGVVPACNNKFPPVGRVRNISSILDLCCSQTARPPSETGFAPRHRAHRQAQAGGCFRYQMQNQCGTCEHDLFV